MKRGGRGMPRLQLQLQLFCPLFVPQRCTTCFTPSTAAAAVLCSTLLSVCLCVIGLVTLKDLIFHKPATRSVCVPSVLHFTHHSDNGVRTKAVRLAANLLWPDPAFQATVEAFAKQVGM